MSTYLSGCRSIWGPMGMVKMQPSTAHTAGMRRSTSCGKNADKLLGSASKTFTVKGAVIIKDGHMHATGAIVRRFDMDKGTAMWNGLKVAAIGGNNMGWTDTFRVL